MFSNSLKNGESIANFLMHMQKDHVKRIIQPTKPSVAPSGRLRLDI